MALVSLMWVNSCLNKKKLKFELHQIKRKCLVINNKPKNKHFYKNSEVSKTWIFNKLIN